MVSSFHYLWFVIPEPHYSIYRDSDNIVARICLPQMRWEGQDEKIDAYARAVSGVLTLETDPRRREKYLDYVDTYAKLDEAERKLFQALVAPYPEGGNGGGSLFRRLIRYSLSAVQAFRHA